MRLTNFAIGHRTTVLVLIVLIVVAGTMSYRSLPRESNPEIEIPMVIVTTPYEGASPSDVESLITRPLERELTNITEIKELRSTSAEGISSVQVEFEVDFDSDTALQKVRDKVDRAEPDLPDDLRQDPMVQEISGSDIFPLLMVNVAGDVGVVRLKEIAEDIEEEIETVPGVLDVELIGALEREIRIEFDQDRLAAYGLTLQEITQTIISNNVNTPGGSLDIGEAKYSLKVPAEFDTPDEIENLVIAVRDGEPIYLNDIARVRDTFKDRESYSRIDGRESVTLRVTKRQGENILNMATQIKELLADWEKNRLPAGVELIITSDSSEDIEQMVTDLENNILSALVLVLVVIFTALGFRNAMLVALAIPFAMLISFSLIQGFGMTLNMVVLFSLILALGMLVDNAIVIVENIYRHHVNEGKPLIEAAKVATDEVAWPVIASTATTVAAFLPLLFWPGLMGEFMGYLPRTVILTLLASLFVAIVINPALGSMFIKKPFRQTEQLNPDPEDPTRGSKILRVYQRLLEISLQYRVLILFFFVGLLVVLIRCYAQSGLGSKLFPETAPERINVALEAPEGTNVERTNQFAREAERIIARYGNLEHVTTTVGSGSDGGGMGGGVSSSNSADILVDMVKRQDRAAQGPGDKIYFADSNDTMEAMRTKLVEALVGVEVRVEQQEMGPPTDAPINVEISGENYEVLAGLANQLRGRMLNLPGLVDITDDYQSGLPEIDVRIDKERAALLGLNAYTIGRVIKAAVNGIKIGDYREGEDEYDITARLPDVQRETLPDILRLRIPDPMGNQVPLSSVARVQTTSGLAAIKHIDERRVITVSSNVTKGYNAHERLGKVQELARRIQRELAPPGYEFHFTGENEEFEKAMNFLPWAFILGVLTIALVLVTQFDSILQPLIVLTSVALSLIGVFFGLLVLHEPFIVIMTGMGVISLAGVVVNNAIVLLDYINLQRKWGRPCREAIIRAAVTRFRPVLLTAATTILSLMPMATGVSFDFRALQWDIGSESSQFWGPMAATVIFGLLVATTLTLVMLPNLYSLVYDRESRRGWTREHPGVLTSTQSANPHRSPEDDGIDQPPAHKLT